VRITSTLIRVEGDGLLRRSTKFGHSRPSMTQDVYMGRRAVDSQAALALEAALRDVAAGGEKVGKSVGKEEGQTP
jgi:hypothetical protein